MEKRLAPSQTEKLSVSPRVCVTAWGGRENGLASGRTQKLSVSPRVCVIAWGGRENGLASGRTQKLSVSLRVCVTAWGGREKRLASGRTRKFIVFSDLPYNMGRKREKRRTGEAFAFFRLPVVVSELISVSMEKALIVEVVSLPVAGKRAVNPGFHRRVRRLFIPNSPRRVQAFRLWSGRGRLIAAAPRTG